MRISAFILAVALAALPVAAKANIIVAYSPPNLAGTCVFPQAPPAGDVLLDTLAQLQVQSVSSIASNGSYFSQLQFNGNFGANVMAFGLTAPAGLTNRLTLTGITSSGCLDLHGANPASFSYVRGNTNLPSTTLSTPPLALTYGGAAVCLVEDTENAGAKTITIGSNSVVPYGVGPLRSVWSTGFPTSSPTCTATFSTPRTATMLFFTVGGL